jgi:hypothetical protein
MPLAKLGTMAGGLQWALCILLKFSHQLKDAIPTSIRFLFYELEQMGVIPKHQGEPGGRTPAQNVADALMALREAGLVPWHWIVDETRHLSVWQYARTVYEYILESVEVARIDCWDGAAPPLILTESRSLAQVLERTAMEFLCPIAATNGQVGGFLHTDIIPLLLERRRRVLYFGDLDNQGGDIEANTRRVIEAETGPLDWTRLALTPAQVAQYQIPSIEKIDRRYKEGHALRSGLAYETEAMGQTAIVGLLRDYLTGLLPRPLAGVRRLEAREQQEARRMLTALAPLKPAERALVREVALALSRLGPAERTQLLALVRTPRRRTP